jgi:glycosyltransferase involved in cell wall biosynthesis
MGKLDYLPNREACDFLVRLSRHLTSQCDTGWILEIAGSPVPEYIHEPGITFLGYVPDMHAAVSRADICLAPIFSGSGTRLKILEYCIHAKPVITTRLGAEGLGLENTAHVVYAQTIEQFTEAIVELWNNPADARTRAQNACRFVSQRYTWDAIVAHYEQELIARLDI